MRVPPSKLASWFTSGPRRLRLLQPEAHVHLAVHRRRGGEVLLRLLALRPCAGRACRGRGGSGRRAGACRARRRAPGPGGSGASAVSASGGRDGRRSRRGGGGRRPRARAPRARGRASSACSAEARAPRRAGPASEVRLAERCTSQPRADDARSPRARSTAPRSSSGQRLASAARERRSAAPRRRGDERSTRTTCHVAAEREAALEQRDAPAPRSPLTEVDVRRAPSDADDQAERVIGRLGDPDGVLGRARGASANRAELGERSAPARPRRAPTGRPACPKRSQRQVAVERRDGLAEQRRSPARYSPRGSAAVPEIGTCATTWSRTSPSVSRDRQGALGAEPRAPRRSRQSTRRWLAMKVATRPSRRWSSERLGEAPRPRGGAPRIRANSPSGYERVAEVEAEVDGLLRSSRGSRAGAPRRPSACSK